MTKYLNKKAAALFIAITIFLTTSTISMGTYQIPTSVRVGLYYKDTSTNTALSIFNVSAAAGLQIGFSKDNSFTEMYREASSSTLYVRKDAYYYNSGDLLKEYNPATTSADSIASFAKYGPYHIKIGNDYPDAASAGAQAAAYRLMGIQAYIVYVDTWQVWAGSNVDEASAQADLPSLRAKLGEVGYVVVPPSANRIVLTNAQYQPLCIFGSNGSYFQLRPAPENNPPILNIKEKLYRGALEVRRLETSDMTVINVVSMQEYLYGNVPAEIGGRSPVEAIKAQAIASKMYAINNMGKHGKMGFDLCATTSCQVYKGYSSEVAECNSAIDEVKDKIITYDNKPAGYIFYFASSGGRTEDVRNVWGSSYPYLVSVEDKYEKIYAWTKTLRASDIKSKLPQLGNILGISITKTAESGRVTQLAVRGTSRSDPAFYALEKTRTLFSLDSQLYTITTDADVYTASLSYAPAVTASASAESTIAAASNITVQGNLYATSTESSTTVDSALTTESAASINSASTTESAITSEPTISHAVTLPAISAPQKTQLGGKKVITASGVTSLTASNNKVTILGSDGKIKKATLVPETYTFTGKGWGHAVGMSQEGAIGMGKAGIKYDAILTHYFQGTKIE